MANALILGATGNVGSGAAYAFLKSGANVIVVSRSQDKLKHLLQQLSDFKDHLTGIVGSFDNEQQVNSLKQKVLETLQGKPLHHVVSSLGFVKFFGEKAATECSADDFRSVIDDGVIPNFLAAKAFLPLLRDVQGSTFTLVSGGFAYATPFPKVWAGTIKNATVNALTFALQAEYPSVSINSAVISFGVAEHGGKKNQFGFDAVDSYDLGEVFVAIPLSKKKGQLINMNTFEEVQSLIKQWKQ